MPAAALPEVRPSSGRFGVTDGRDGRCPAGVPVSGIAGDQQAALFGQACFEPGMTKNTYGTGSFVLMNVGSECPEPVDGLLTTVAWQLDDHTDYAYEGAIFSTGSAVQWLRDGLGIIDERGGDRAAGPLRARPPTTSTSCPRSPASAARGGTPTPRGTIVGVTRGTTRAHLARAVVEAMAFQTRDVVEAMASAAGRPVAALRADGGASVMDLLLELQADQLGVPVARPVVQETTALGAAYLAGLAEGVWGSLDELAGQWALDIEVEPSPDRDRRRRGARALARGRRPVEELERVTDHDAAAEANDRMVRDFLAAWERRDTDHIVERFAEDGVYHSTPLTPIVGREAIRAFVAGFADKPPGGSRSTARSRRPRS